MVLAESGWSVRRRWQQLLSRLSRLHAHRTAGRPHILTRVIDTSYKTICTSLPTIPSADMKRILLGLLSPARTKGRNPMDRPDERLHARAGRPPSPGTASPSGRV